MEDEFKPSVPPQRRVNPNIKEVVPKKGGITVVKNKNDELIPQWTVIGWRMLERLAGHEYYYFLDGFFGYLQILIAPEDQEKTTLPALTVPSHTNECHSDYAMPQPLFNAA
ncbi:hypothetical protein Tco_0477472 [Tanacetum coccineum]